jgi:hypothetical protein
VPEPAASTVRNEKRRAKRRQLFIAATIAFEPNQVRPCSVHDVSETGARIETPRPESVPNRFTLLLTPHGFPRRECHVVWRREGLLGVTFEKHPMLPDRV